MKMEAITYEEVETLLQAAGLPDPMEPCYVDGGTRQLLPDGRTGWYRVAADYKVDGYKCNGSSESHCDLPDGSKLIRRSSYSGYGGRGDSETYYIDYPAGVAYPAMRHQSDMDEPIVHEFDLA